MLDVIYYRKLFLIHIAAIADSHQSSEIDVVVIWCSTLTHSLTHDDIMIFRIFYALIVIHVWLGYVYRIEITFDIQLTLSWINRSHSDAGSYSDLIIRRVIVWRIIGWTRLSYVECSSRIAVPNMASKKHITCVIINYTRWEKKMFYIMKLSC